MLLLSTFTRHTTSIPRRTCSKGRLDSFYEHTDVPLHQRHTSQSMRTPAAKQRGEVPWSTTLGNESWPLVIAGKRIGSSEIASSQLATAWDEVLKS